MWRFQYSGMWLHAVTIQKMVILGVRTLSVSVRGICWYIVGFCFTCALRTGEIWDSDYSECRDYGLLECVEVQSGRVSTNGVTTRKATIFWIICLWYSTSSSYVTRVWYRLTAVNSLTSSCTSLWLIIVSTIIHYIYIYIYIHIHTHTYILCMKWHKTDACC